MTQNHHWERQLDTWNKTKPSQWAEVKHLRARCQSHPCKCKTETENDKKPPQQVEVGELEWCKDTILSRSGIHGTTQSQMSKWHLYTWNDVEPPISRNGTPETMQNNPNVCHCKVQMTRSNPIHQWWENWDDTVKLSETSWTMHSHWLSNSKTSKMT